MHHGAWHIWLGAWSCCTAAVLNFCTTSSLLWCGLIATDADKGLYTTDRSSRWRLILYWINSSFFFRIISSKTLLHIEDRSRIIEMIAAFLRHFLLLITFSTFCVGFKHYGKAAYHASHSYMYMGGTTQLPERDGARETKPFIHFISKFSKTTIAMYSIMAGVTVRAASAADTASVPNTPSRGFQTKSGLKYFDFNEGVIGATPRYGQLVSFQYTGYYRATADSPLEVFDSVFSSDRKNKQSFLHKHGNGRIVRGIDEALHSMKVGGKRRVVVPRSIGYTDFGTGPVPTEPSDRRKLEKFLEYLDADKGELVFDLELVMVADDENDQGYYEDEPVTQEEVRKMVLKSMSTEDNVERMDKMMQTTPKEKLFKKVVDVISG